MTQKKDSETSLKEAISQYRDKRGFESAFLLPNAGLKSYFGRVERGSDEVIRTHFYQGRKVSKILADWAVQLEKLKDEWPTLLDFEYDLAKKVGPLSVMKPLIERLPDIDSYYESILLDSEPISTEAAQRVVDEWASASGLLIRGQARTVDTMKKSTSSGSPFFTKRKNVVDKTIPCVMDTYDGDPEPYQLLGRDATPWMSCAVLGWRGQEGGPLPEDVKQRVVWMFPFGVNVAELQVYQPLIEASQRNGLVPAWIGMESVDERITRMFDTKDPNDLVICTDFSKFDQHFNHDMQSTAAYILEHIFDDSNMHDWLASVFPIKYQIPLALDYGYIRYGDHGMASGSGGTNADETLTHRALQYEAALEAGEQLNLNSQCLGDDGILTFPNCTIEKVTSTYTRHGQEMNLDKQYASKTDCTYLRRWHHTDYRVNGVCVGVYATMRALGRLCMQERFYDPRVWSNKMEALRQLSIIENVKWHPLRDKFVDYCMKGDQFRLGIDIPGFLDNIGKYAKEATDYMPDFLGYSRSLGQDSGAGIENWWVVQYLKSKA